jgi:hypothetical protein
MSLKLKALLQLVGLIAFAAGISLSIDYIAANVARETFLNAIGFAFIGGTLYLGYEILLARLESQETLKKIEQDLKK